ncbi:hypothetical protein [Streptomyces sp. S.PB5]|uniref:hypothetical protein n=1 Tax=Streptomyces sp. S.PB5 TaxID=3020844 RepID=UPI0025AEDE37|nr:hypothetical protein [Streptomyces sp. S.PB5]MDN3027200.1 hypothetical protein [Streptomyces sp. S.PB5]
MSHRQHADEQGDPLEAMQTAGAGAAGLTPARLDNLVASGLPALTGLADAIRGDQPAVVQGITTAFNSGVNEGRITDLKLQKRIMAHLRRQFREPTTRCGC